MNQILLQLCLGIKSCLGYQNISVDLALTCWHLASCLFHIFTSLYLLCYNSLNAIIPLIITVDSWLLLVASTSHGRAYFSVQYYTLCAVLI